MTDTQAIFTPENISLIIEQLGAMVTTCKLLGTNLSWFDIHPILWEQLKGRLPVWSPTSPMTYRLNGTPVFRDVQSITSPFEFGVNMRSTYRRFKFDFVAD